MAIHARNTAYQCLRSGRACKRCQPISTANDGHAALWSDPNDDLKAILDAGGKWIFTR